MANFTPKTRELIRKIDRNKALCKYLNEKEMISWAGGDSTWMCFLCDKTYVRGIKNNNMRWQIDTEIRPSEVIRHFKAKHEDELTLAMLFVM